MRRRGPEGPRRSRTHAWTKPPCPRACGLPIHRDLVLGEEDDALAGGVIHRHQVSGHAAIGRLRPPEYGALVAGEVVRHGGPCRDQHPVARLWFLGHAPPPLATGAVCQRAGRPRRGTGDRFAVERVRGLPAAAVAHEEAEEEGVLAGNVDVGRLTHDYLDAAGAGRPGCPRECTAVGDGAKRIRAAGAFSPAGRLSAYYQRVNDGDQRLPSVSVCGRWVTGAGPGPLACRGG